MRMQVVDLGQDGTGQYYEQGFVHLVVTATGGLDVRFVDIQPGASGSSSDQAGLAWDSTAATLGHNHVYASLRSGTDNVVDFYFPPARDEAPPSGSTAPTMTLLTLCAGCVHRLYDHICGRRLEPRRPDECLRQPARPSPAPTTEAELRALLASTSPEYDTIDLPANTTIVVTQPLEITHSVAIIGNNSTLLFQQGSTAAWPASASGAIYVDAPAYTNIQLTLSGFTIEFDMSAPIRWSNPSGAGPALFDPENNPAGIEHAVIDTRDSNTNLNLTVAHAEQHADLRAAGFRRLGRLHTLSAQAGPERGSARSVRRRAGHGSGPDQRPRHRLDLEFDVSGRVDRALSAGRGPSPETRSWARWPETYSPAAFALHSPHDVTLEGNQVTQSDPAGREFRLVNLAVSGYDNVIEGNTFGGGAGSDRQRVYLFRGHGPVLRHQRSRSHPGREHLRRPVRGKARRGLRRRPAARSARRQGVGRRRLDRARAWSSRFLRA